MELLAHLTLGFGTALTAVNLGYALAGCLLGTLIGVLPGIGPLATIAMLLPLTYALEPVTALIMLAGIYYGAQYGGSTTAIVVNLPGESSSVATAIDGYQMARQGRAGIALAVAAVGSFFAGCVATLAIAALAVPLSDLALLFGPRDYFSLMVLGLLLAVVLTTGPLLEGVGLVVTGMLLSLVGTDVLSGVQRFTFDIPRLYDGLDFVPLSVGIFGLVEIVRNLKEPADRPPVAAGIAGMMPTRADIARALPAILRGTGVGTVLGALPGGGAAISAFVAYALEKNLSRHRAEFGRGAIEGVAGPEAANNAGAQTSFIPLLTLGLPANAVMALMVGAMTIHDIQPGPQVMTRNPELFWGLIASMWVGNLMLVVLNLPLAGLWVRLLTIPYRFLYPAIMVFCAIGLYSLKSDSFEIYEAALACLAGYLLAWLELPVAPLLLGFVLGPALEESFRRTMLLSRGDATVFFASPLSAGLLALAATALLATLWRRRQGGSLDLPEPDLCRAPAGRQGASTIDFEDLTMTTMDDILGPVLDWRPAGEPRRSVLQGALVRLEPIAIGHAADLYAASHGPDADPRLWDYMSVGPFADQASFTRWVEGCVASSDPLFFTVVDQATGRAMGVVSYMRIAAGQGVIEIGNIWFGTGLPRTPAATETIFILARHVFDDLGYRRLEWKCNALNQPSRRAALRFGFSYEGLFRQHMVIKGRNRDTAWFAMTDGDWPAIKAAFETWLAPANFDAGGRQVRGLAEIRGLR